MKLPTDPPLVIPVDCAPEQAPCPHCGQLARRQRVCRRPVRTIAYKQVAYLDITYGEYKARCGCCQTFRTGPEGVLPKHAYDNKVRQAVLEHILDDRMNVEATRACLRRDFLLDLSQGFVYDCLHEAVRQTDCAGYRRQVLERFPRHAVPGRAAPGRLHPAAGHRPAGRLPRGLRPGQQQ